MLGNQLGAQADSSYDWLLKHALCAGISSIISLWDMITLVSSVSGRWIALSDLHPLSECVCCLPCSTIPPPCPFSSAAGDKKLVFHCQALAFVNQTERCSCCGGCVEPHNMSLTMFLGVVARISEWAPNHRSSCMGTRPGPRCCAIDIGRLNVCGSKYDGNTAGWSCGPFAARGSYLDASLCLHQHTHTPSPSLVWIRITVVYLRH